MEYILTVDKYGRRILKDSTLITVGNTTKLNGKEDTSFLQTGKIVPGAYRVTTNLVLSLFEASLYVLDGATNTTLTLPAIPERSAQITVINPTKGNFIIHGNGIKIVRDGTEVNSITLTEYQTLTLIYLDIGQDHASLWYAK